MEDISEYKQQIPENRVVPVDYNSNILHGDKLGSGLTTIGEYLPTVTYCLLLNKTSPYVLPTQTAYIKMLFKVGIISWVKESNSWRINNVGWLYSETSLIRK